MTRDRCKRLSDASAWITGATLDIAGGKIYA